MPALPLTKLCNVRQNTESPAPQFHDLSNADNNSPYIIGLLSELNKFKVQLTTVTDIYKLLKKCYPLF